MSEIATLVHRLQGADEYGDPTITETGRTVFCREASVGQKEFYQAQAVGLQPEIKLIIPDYLDYQGEPFVRYTPKGQTLEQLYRVLRTYRAGLEIELVCYREVNPV